MTDRRVTDPRRRRMVPNGQRRSIGRVLEERDCELDEARELAVRAGWDQLFAEPDSEDDR